MDYNYHTHTHRCNHASGTEEEYIKRAIEGGVAYMGFSDHTPYQLPDGRESWYRVSVNEAKDYVADLSALREKYKDKIEIMIGFEMEYYPSCFREMFQTAQKYGGEYLILGQHFFEEEHGDYPHTTTATDDVELLKIYVSRVTDAMKTGVFTYVAHPDIFHFTGDRDCYQQEMRNICKTSKEQNVPLEINFLGIRDNRMYPREDFWEVAGQEKSPVTFGFDAHDVQSAFDGQSLIKAKEMVKQFHLNYIGKPRIRRIQEISI